MTTVYVTADWTFTPATLTLRYADSEEEVVLDPKSSRLLGYLLRCYPQVCTREDIYFELYGIENARADGTITAYVSKLRKLLEARANAKGKYIKTIPKTGYQFIAPHKIETLSLKQESAPDKEATQYQNQSTEVSGVTTFSSNESSIVKPNPGAFRLEEQDQGPIVRISELPFRKSLIYLALSLAVVIFILANLIYSDDEVSSNSSNQLQNNELSTSDWRLIHAESGINHSLAISDDGLFLAYVSDEQNVNRLYVKSVWAEQLNIAFQSRHEKIYSPAFSPDGQRVAFISVDGFECRLNLIELDAQGDLIADSHMVLTTCDIQQKTTPVAFWGEDSILFIGKNPSQTQGELTLYDISSGLNKTLLSRTKAADGIEAQAVDYYFAIERNNQQIAVLKQYENGTSGVYLVFLDENKAQHIVNVESRLTGLEWLNTEQLIVMEQGQLQLIDLDKKDIRPISFAQVREVLKQQNS